MKKKILLVLILGFGLASITTAAQDTWTTKTSMPTARGYLSTAVVNGKIYAFGGALSANSGTSVVEEYDPATNTWARVSNMPETRFAPSTTAVDGIIYLIGGSTSLQGAGLRTVYSYDPSTDTWTQKADMLTPRQAFSASVVDGKIYTIGGWNGSRIVSTAEVYDPATETWTRKADMPTARFYPSGEAVNGKIYVIGGIAGTTGPVLDTVEEYDPLTDTWTQKADMPRPTCRFSTATVDGKIYAIGGGLASGGPYSSVEQYDPITNSWIAKSPMPTARRALAASVVNGKIFAIGGIGGSSGSAALRTVEEYDTGIPPRSPDFNGDGIVDSIDMCMLVEHWQTDYPLCDIAPPPFGDGIVDVQDLIAVAEHLFEEIFPPDLIAYWKLDEAKGDIAFNSTSDNHGVLSGSPEWQPETGKIEGTLELDGIDDYIDAGFVLNPADGPFSVLTWIKGGAPGQVIIAQTDGSGTGEIWLGADASAGNLMTGLVPPPVGRFVPQPLISETIITDGQWHHTAFVWDGAYRTLYVDGTEVARDPAVQNPLKSATGGMIIGAGKNLEDGTFFSGLIDDVRIYNAALTTEQIAAMAQ